MQLFGDFDLNIREILLVHRYHYACNYRHTAYLSGRKMAGIVYCISGAAIYTVGEARIRLEPQHMIFLPEHCSYSVQTTGDEPFYHITANFHLEIPEELRDFADLANGKTVGIPVPITSPRGTEDLEMLVSVWRTKKSGYQVLSKALLYRVLHLYFSSLNQKYRDGEYELIRAAKDFLDEHFTSHETVGELAALCHLSETHFRRIFTKVIGVSPNEYRRNKRILQAKDMLLSGEISIGEIAQAVGFSDNNYFSRVFRETVGMSPSEFLREGR